MAVGSANLAHVNAKNHRRESDRRGDFHKPDLTAVDPGLELREGEKKRGGRGRWRGGEGRKMRRQ
jgi:hypothetical protein